MCIYVTVSQRRMEVLQVLLKLFAGTKDVCVAICIQIVIILNYSSGRKQLHMIINSTHDLHFNLYKRDIAIKTIPP